jgi:hypothetical protein
MHKNSRRNREEVISGYFLGIPGVHHIKSSVHLIFSDTDENGKNIIVFCQIIVYFYIKY